MLAGLADKNVTPQSNNVISTKLEECLSENEATLFDRLSLDGTDENEEAEIKDYNFVFKEGNHLVTQWSGSVVQDALYIEFSDGKLPVGSRECFVMLLDYAEETLEVATVIICFPRNQVDKPEILRVFMYLGFEVVHHSVCKLVPASDSFMFMAYGFE